MSVAQAVDPARVHDLNDRPVTPGKYVLYWMQASQRESCNPALEHAIGLANELSLPVVVCFGLVDDFPEANARSYHFLAEGLRDVEAHLARRDILFVTRKGKLPDVPLALARDAARVVCDVGYTAHQRHWRDVLADDAPCRVTQVESDVVIPVGVVSDKHEYAARTIRPKIHKHLKEYLHPLGKRRPKKSSLHLKFPHTLDLSDPAKLVANLKLDPSVPASKQYRGGQLQAHELLNSFVARHLGHYDEARNEPAAAATSRMSMYLHYGHISPIEIALAVRDAAAPGADVDAYLEELIVRRELSVNFCHFVANYATYEALPDWARKTLARHAKDKRPHLYTRDQLEGAKTHDPYWNAAQLELTKTGFMHNYMRMYWGKKILEWTREPEEAFAWTLAINNKYQLDGRDPNSFANVAWIFGLHDRPWGPERPIFGLVRYMNATGLERKFDIDAYVKKIAALD